MHIKKLELFTSDGSALLHFYRDVLGCSVQEETNGFTLHTAATTVQWVEDKTASFKYHIAFAIPWNQVAAALQWTRAKVPLLECAPQHYLADFTAWKAQAFYFEDPAGNIVEFISREPLGLESIPPFDGTSLASVSEIGIVTDDVTLACRQLAEIWGVPIFSRQQPTPNFAALGDDHGLLIVVQEGRPWFPTQTKATKAPLSVLFEAFDGTVRLLKFE